MALIFNRDVLGRSALSRWLFETERRRTIDHLVRILTLDAAEPLAAGLHHARRLVPCLTAPGRLASAAMLSAALRPAMTWQQIGRQQWEA